MLQHVPCSGQPPQDLPEPSQHRARCSGKGQRKVSPGTFSAPAMQHPPNAPPAIQGCQQAKGENFSTWVWGAPEVRHDLSLKSVDEKCCVRMRNFLLLLLYNPQGQDLK